MKHTFTFLLIATLFCTAAPVFAEETDHEYTVLSAQLDALQDYLARVYGERTFSPLSDTTIRDIISDGVSWLLRAQEPSGHFRYEYVPYEDRYRVDDNIVRQGGALFELSEVYRRQAHKDTQIATGIEKAISYFDGLSVEGEKEGHTFSCVANSEGSSQCKLGATALVLIGILGYVEGNPEVMEEYAQQITLYTNYILASQKEEGGFSNVYRSSSGFASEESPFSNGEALLALVRSYQHKEDARVKTAIDTAFSYLEQKEFDSALYLWIMAALKDMQQLYPDQRYTQYARDFTSWRVLRASRTYSDRNYCAYIEGLASAYSVLKDTSPETLVPLRKDIDTFNAYHATLQLQEGDLFRVVSHAEGGLSLQQLVDPERATGGFLTAFSHPTQRIDFTQHCISAYVQTLVDIDGGTL